jgi:colanic acid biosynthesis glycosyl transferase WcaI
MNVILLTAYFPPEIGSAAHLFADIGAEMVQRGHSVTVLTGYPTYNIDPATLPEKYRTGLWRVEEYAGMNVVRTRTIQMPRHVPTLRGIDQVTSALMQIITGLRFCKGQTDAIVVYSPPLFLGMTAWALRVLKGGSVVLNVQDLFPQSAIDLGVLKSRILVRFFRWIERLLYRNADAVTVHSPGNRDHVIQMGGIAEKTFVMHNVVDTRQIQPGERMNALRKAEGIAESTTVVSFAGVLGYSQDLDTVIDAARTFEGKHDVLFLIVGDGVEKARLQEKAKDLNNTRFLPMLPKEQYPSLLHASDICLVTLRNAVQTPVVPSKILSIMAAARPVLAGLPLHGDAPALIKEAGCGLCVEPENAKALADALGTMINNRNSWKTYGENGRKFAESHLSLGASVDHYEAIIRNLLVRKREMR